MGNVGTSDISVSPAENGTKILFSLTQRGSFEREEEGEHFRAEKNVQEDIETNGMGEVVGIAHVSIRIRKRQCNATIHTPVRRMKTLHLHALVTIFTYARTCGSTSLR